jgi:hypothetical protein
MINAYYFAIMLLLSILIQPVSQQEASAGVPAVFNLFFSGNVMGELEACG